MVNDINLNLYQGQGVPISQREPEEILPEYQPLIDGDSPKNYIADTALKHAVNTAIALGQPLLITGEPGTGKTQLAFSIAFELDLPHPLVFHTKTTSIATDLFYHYDALRRFHDSHMQIDKKLELNPENYIIYQAFGQAILLTQKKENVEQLLSKTLLKNCPTRSVVLVDEMDKAPRDLPNDMLNEIEKMEFTVKETGKKYIAEEKYRPILILTSNSERNLPDAFLRRCIFYHISFPSDEQLSEIVKKRFSNQQKFSPEFIYTAIKHLTEIRELPLKKKPATAEFLSWIRVLNSLDLDINNLQSNQIDTFALSFSILAKDREDYALLQKKYMNNI
jgi:MoxR-like ATPase